MNEIKLAPPWGYSVFCDDIRKEADNKYSLMGIYSGQIYLPEFPALLSKFCVAVTYFEEFNKAPEDLCLRLYVPGDLPDVPSFFIPLAQACNASGGKDARRGVFDCDNVPAV